MEVSKPPAVPEGGRRKSKCLLLRLNENEPGPVLCCCLQPPKDSHGKIALQPSPGAAENDPEFCNSLISSFIYKMRLDQPHARCAKAKGPCWRQIFFRGTRLLYPLQPCSIRGRQRRWGIAESINQRFAAKCAISRATWP